MTSFRELFVSRTDLYARAVKGKDRVKYVPVKQPLDDAALALHLSGKQSVGCYLVNPETDQARVIVLDVDSNEQELVTRLVDNARARFPLNSIVVERTGGRGWHIWVLFEDWMPSAAARGLGRAVAGADVKSIEVYPKGNVGPDHFGALVRLPLGKHPRSGRESTVYTADWQPASLDDFVPGPVPGDAPAPRTASTPQRAVGTRFACIQALEGGVSEGERDEAAFTLACYHRDQNRDADLALVLLRAVNVRNQPPLDDAVLEEKVESAYGGGAKIGCASPILERHCDPNCPMKRSAPQAKDVHVWDSTELMHAEVPPTHWVVRGMFPQGFGLLAGRPKIGKSWLALLLARCVALGEPFLGHDTNRSAVLYLALEDSQARMKERLHKLEFPDGIPVSHVLDFPRIGDQGGIELLAGILETGYVSPDQSVALEYGLVIVDSLSRAKSIASDELRPEDMERVIRPLQELGHKRGILVLAIHHHRKSATGDVIWDSRGSGAIAGVADVVAGVYPPDDGLYAFKSQGRDAPDVEYALRFEDGLWRMESDARVLNLKPGDRELLRVLGELKHATELDLSSRMKVNRGSLHQRLLRLVEQKAVWVDRTKRPWSFSALTPPKDQGDQLDFSIGE
jgi:hypothetical protein